MFTPTLKLIPYHEDAPLFPQPPLGWIMHTQEGIGSPYRYFAGLEAPNRKFSSLWISKRGVCEQYQTLTRVPWAQGLGNPLYWAVEFEGFATESLTPLQIMFGALLHNSLNAADLVINRPGQRGIGTHAMGGVGWGNHPLCPGTLRASQRIDIIGAAQNQRRPEHPFPGGCRMGTYGPIVRQVQRRLNHYGYRLAVDGIFGPLTDKAVRSFQATHKLTVDGIVGPLTWERLWH
jgi:hypothetical protein